MDVNRRTAGNLASGLLMSHAVQFSPLLTVSEILGGAVSSLNLDMEGLLGFSAGRLRRLVVNSWSVSRPARFSCNGGGVVDAGVNVIVILFWFLEFSRSCSRWVVGGNAID